MRKKINEEKGPGGERCKLGGKVRQTSAVDEEGGRYKQGKVAAPWARWVAYIG